jgi:hypothetical protein
MAATLGKELARYLDINTGRAPIRTPKGVEEIKLLRIFISILRQAEDDYLSPNTPPGDLVKAEQALFGLHLSPLPGVCRILGIDYHAARMKLLEWKVSGRVGDPIFGFLTKASSMEQFEQYQTIDGPKFDEESHVRKEKHDRPPGLQG